MAFPWKIRPPPATLPGAVKGRTEPGPFLNSPMGLLSGRGVRERLLGTGALLFGDCPRLRSNGTGTAADGGASPLVFASARFRDEPL